MPHETSYFEHPVRADPFESDDPTRTVFYGKRRLEHVADLELSEFWASQSTSILTEMNPFRPIEEFRIYACCRSGDLERVGHSFDAPASNHIRIS